ncbi:hypothetical protein AAHE18_18G191700 [Arachis hypogaea]
MPSYLILNPKMGFVPAFTQNIFTRKFERYSGSHRWLRSMKANIHWAVWACHAYEQILSTVSYLVLFSFVSGAKDEKAVLMIALVPDGAGKPTVKLEKVAIRGGSCLWDKPIFETVKFVRDTKSGKLQEKIYHFIVSTISYRFVIAYYIVYRTRTSNRGSNF